MVKCTLFALVSKISHLQCIACIHEWWQVNVTLSGKTGKCDCMGTHAMTYSMLSVPQLPGDAHTLVINKDTVAIVWHAKAFVCGTAK